MAINGNSSSMQSDQYFAEMLSIMRGQGRRDNPTTLQLGVMQSENSVKIDDLTLNAEDLYIADYLVSEYTRELKEPYLSDASLNVSYGDYVSDVSIKLTKQEKVICKDGLKKGDLVAVQKLHNTNKFVILAKVVAVK